MDHFPLQFTAPTVIRATNTTRMVKSVTLSGHGDISRIKVEETPMEICLENDEVEVQVHYCGLNFTDNYLRLGIIRNEKFPVIMGSECSGIITRVGNNVKNFEVGGKVLCLQMHAGLFRQMVHVPEKHCFRVPDIVSLKDAVAFGLSFVVAHVCLFEIANLKPKQRVFMQSIAGGVGTAVVQLCRTVGDVEVFGTASELKQDDLLTLGMRRVYCPEENYVGRMLRFFPEGADIVINSNGGTDAEKCCKILRRCGTLINIGSNSTAWYPKSTAWGLVKPSWDTTNFSTAELISSNYSVAGLNVGVWLKDYPQKVRTVLTEVFQMHIKEKLQPVVHSVIPFKRVAGGIKELCERKNYGKIILELEQASFPTPIRRVSKPQQQEKLEERMSTSTLTFGDHITIKGPQQSDTKPEVVPIPEGISEVQNM